MSGIRKTRENYIAGRYYSPVIKQFLSPVNPETVLADALSAYGLNLYSLCLTNPVNLAYNEYTIEPGVELTYTPPALSAWDLFWRRPIAKVLAVTLFCFATLLAILNPAFLPLYFETLAGIATSLLMGATIAGLQARENGDPFWQSFGNYLNENWAQTLAVSMAVFIIICGVSLAYHAYFTPNEEQAANPIESNSKPQQEHHYLTNKNKKYTPQFQAVLDKYGLNLNESWNKELLPHGGRHATEYHEYMLAGIKDIDAIAQGNADIFLKQFEVLKSTIRANPEMMYKTFWLNGKF